MHRITWAALALLMIAWSACAGDDNDAAGGGDAGDSCAGSSSEGDLDVAFELEAGVAAIEDEVPGHCSSHPDRRGHGA